MPVYLYDENENIIKKGKGKGKWKYVFQQGGTRYKGVIHGATTRKEAEEYETTMRAAVRNGTYGQPSQDITFEDFAQNNYLKWAKQHRRAHRWFALMVNVCCRHFKNKPLRGITTGDVESYLAKRRDEKSLRGIQRAGASVNRERAILSGIFTRAIKRGFHPGPNPCRDIERYEETGRRERVLSREEETQLLAALTGQNEVLRHIVEIALGTGMRRGEVLKLHWEYLDFERGKHGYINLPATITKSKKPRSVPMLYDVRPLLLSLKGTKTEGRVFNLDENSAGQRVARMCKKLGLSGVTLHTMRHTFATRCIDAGVHSFVLKEWLGHSTLAQTNYYTHVGFAEMEQAAQKLEKTPENRLNCSADVPQFSESTKIDAANNCM